MKTYVAMRDVIVLDPDGPPIVVRAGERVTERCPAIVNETHPGAFVPEVPEPADLEAAVDEIGEAMPLEERVLMAAAAEDVAEFLRLAELMPGGLPEAQRIVRTKGWLERPIPEPPRLIEAGE